MKKKVPGHGRSRDEEPAGRAGPRRICQSPSQLGFQFLYPPSEVRISRFGQILTSLGRFLVVTAPGPLDLSKDFAIRPNLRNSVCRICRHHTFLTYRRGKRFVKENLSVHFLFWDRRITVIWIFYILNCTCRRNCDRRNRRND